MIESYGSSTVSSSGSTRLAQELAPPPTPSLKVPFTLWAYRVLLVLAAVLGICIVNSGSSYGIGEHPYVYFGLVGLFALLVIGTFICARTARVMERINARQYEKDKDSWKEAMTHWERLYYCSRCDCVFALGNEAPVSVSELSPLVP
jgi:hypothetical protein